MHSIKFRVFTKLKPIFLEINGRIPICRHFHGPTTFRLEISNKTPPIRQKLTFPNIGIQCTRSHHLCCPRDISGNTLLSVKFNCKRHCIKWRSDSGDQKNDSPGEKNIRKDKSAQRCGKPINNLHNGFLNAVNYSEKNAVKKKKSAPKRKCGKSVDELRKCLRTMQDVIDFVHPVKPFVSLSRFLQFFK